MSTATNRPRGRPRIPKEIHLRVAHRVQSIAANLMRDGVDKETALLRACGIVERLPREAFRVRTPCPHCGRLMRKDR